MGNAEYMGAAILFLRLGVYYVEMGLRFGNI